ncbi:MAG: hypothetical protein ABI851_16535 [Saprospiraceae bacterium]
MKTDLLFTFVIAFILFQKPTALICQERGNKIPMYSQNPIDQSKIYYDFELQYFPNFQSWRINTDKFYNIIEGREFTDVINQILSSCSENKYELKKYPSWQLSRAGIQPKSLENASMFTIDIDEKGNVIRFNFTNFENRETLEKCFHESLDNSKINPGLANGKPVKSRILYILD